MLAGAMAFFSDCASESSLVRDYQGFSNIQLNSIFFYRKTPHKSKASTLHATTGIFHSSAEVCLVQDRKPQAFANDVFYVELRPG